MKDWLKRSLLEPLLALLRQGIAPDRLALCVAIGIVVGNIPILGVSTILCTLIALGFGLNLPAIQLVQAAMAPVQVLLIIPFVRLGEWLMRAPHQPLTLQQGLEVMAGGVLKALSVLSQAILHAGVAWVLVAPLAVWVLYRVLTPVFTRAAARFARAPT